MPKAPAAAAKRPVGIRLGTYYGLASAKGSVKQTGGRFDSGVIPGFSVITKGEALGHQMWIDDEFMEELTAAVGGRGLKSRFTHPGLSSDGMGRQVGRAYNFRVDGEKVLGDLHIQATARKRKDYGGQVLDWADEDPEAFGMSIVFDPDYGAMDKFTASHKDEDGHFKSPDPENVKNYEHARLARVSAVDVVGDPAANPAGMFDRGSELPALAWASLDYALGLAEDPPEGDLLGVNHERFKLWLGEYLTRKGLSVVSSAPGNGSANGGKDQGMEWAEVDLKGLEAHKADLCGQLRAQGAEEAATAQAADIEKAKQEAHALGVQAERSRLAEIRKQAAEKELSMDSAAVAKIIDDGLEGDKAVVAVCEAKLAAVKAAAQEPLGANPDPEDDDAPATAGPDGLTAEEAWEKDVTLPDGAKVQTEFQVKERFLAWAQNDAEAKGMFVVKA